MKTTVKTTTTVFTGSVDSLLFCQTSERGPRPVPLREGERNEAGCEARKSAERPLFPWSLFSVGRSRLFQPKDEENGEQRRQREGLEERSFYWGGCSCSQGPAIVSCQLDIYATVSPAGREKPGGRVLVYHVYVHRVHGYAGMGYTGWRKRGDRDSFSDCKKGSQRASCYRQHLPPLHWMLRFRR